MTGGREVQCIEVLTGGVLITAGGVGLAVDAEIDFSWLLCELSPAFPSGPAQRSQHPRPGG